MGLYTVQAGVSQAQALDVNQYFNLLTGALPDQVVTLANALQITPAAGGVVAPTSYGTVINKIAETVITATPTANFSFTSIPQVYRHLLMFSAGVTGDQAFSQNLVGQFNNDTTAGDYAASSLAVGGAGAITGSGSSAFGGNILGVVNYNVSAVGFASSMALIFDYAQNVRRIGVINLDVRDDGSLVGRLNFGDFKSATGAITSMLVFPATGNIVNGKFSLWGIP